MTAIDPWDRHNFGWGLYFFAQFIYLLGLATKSRTTRLLFFITLAGMLSYLAWSTTTKNAVNDYGMGSHLFTVIFAALDFLVLTDVQKELYEVDGTFRGNRVGEEDLWTRIHWAFRLQGNPRGIGWSFSAKEPHVRPPSARGTPRHTFILSQLKGIALNIILYDLTGFVNRGNPCFSQAGCRVSQMTLRVDGLRVLAYRYAFIGYGVASYASINILHYIYACLSVGLGITEPWEWPPLFGSFCDAFTVRRFWGRVWHQMMRRFLSSVSGSLAQKLRLPLRSKLTDLFRLSTAFLISAFIHYAGGDRMILGNWKGGSMLFFSLQPLAIVVEEVVISIFQRLRGTHNRLGPISRLVGYLWVATWFAYTVPILAEPQLDVGFFESGPSFSLILGIWRGEWSPQV